ncbi:phosphoserine phosphatase SerB [Rhabdaerophilum calidifontis]|uniref:phosphoserine phosphatase SerB n=1 Tax=Rhabdaerophilum calidifontis TaxID=2604328 RepID=UPI00123C4ADF|nr:phosphoserine phosphatase SerB [Rhabdaerophilum calidifontis]
MPRSIPHPLVATLVAPAANPCLDLAAIARAREALPAAEIAVLAPGRAVDLHFVGDDPALLADSLRAALTGLPVDIAVQPSAARRKRLFLADMDSTMIGQECIDELADMAGLRAEVSAITERAMRGEIAFEPALRERVALLRGLDAAIVERLLAERITLTPGGAELVRTMRRDGAYTALVSGGFTVFTGPVSARIGFDMHRSNVLEIADGRFTGDVRAPILGREAKRETLLELRARLGLPREASLAVGDGANDLAMLGEAGLGVAFRAKPIVAAAAHARIDHTDLRALLYFQGYRDEEIVSGG